jgi:hypothetical protein
MTITSAPSMGGVYALDALPPEEQARRQLFTLFPAGLDRGEWYELRCLDCSVTPARPGPRHFFRSITELVQAAMAYRDRWDVFYGVGLRRCPATDDITRCPHGERGANHISRLTVAWGDFDVRSEGEPTKPYATLEELLGVLLAQAPTPHLIVGSGTGAHAYWPLGAATRQLTRVEQINRGLREKLRADNAVDAARILRVAGTFNRKHGTSLPVRLLRCGDG